MSKSITQDMRYRQSLMQYAAKYGVSRASRKYNKSWSYIYFWKTRWNGSVESLACQSRRPHHHPNQHTEAELNLIRNMRRRNPTLGMIELWQRLRKRGYTRCPESLFRVMRKLGIFPQIKVRTPYKPKPYEQMQYPGQRVQVDMKVVPLKCLANPEERLYQYAKTTSSRLAVRPHGGRQARCPGRTVELSIQRSGTPRVHGRERRGRAPLRRRP